MHLKTLPAAYHQNRPEESAGVSRFDVTTGASLDQKTFVPRPYDYHQASAVKSAYACLTGRIEVANKSAVWNGSLNENLIFKLFYHSNP